MKLLDRFTPLRPLGPYMALVQDADGKPIVLKRMPDDRAHDPIARHDFRLEAWRAGQLEGPRFARLVEDATDAELPFYTMAYAEGPPATLVQPAEAAGCVRQLAEALLALHDQGWVHAGLEPTQLRRTEAGLVLVGYGHLTPHGQRASRPGAGAFQAPEQAAGMPLDGRADLYSLGALIHFWLTGEAAGALDLLDMVADPLAELGRWCLASRPADRPPDVRTLLAALDRVAPPQGPRTIPVETPRAPWLVPAPREVRSLPAFDALLHELDAGQAVWRHVTGGPGSGKTLFLDRAAARAAAAGWPVLRASAEGPWAAPLAPWRTLWQGLAALAAERQPGLPERYRHRLGALAEPLGEPTPAMTAPWAADLPRERSVTALAECLAQLAPPGLVVLLDDWDLADEASRLALLALHQRCQEVPMLWLVAGEGTTGLPPLPMPPLDPEEGRALVAGLMVPPPAPEAAEALLRTAHGLPWFVTTLVHAWVEQGEVRFARPELPAPGTWPAQPGALARLAASVIPEANAWAVGAYAGLLGPRVRADALDLVVAEKGALAAGLDALLAAGVLLREGGHYRFAHPAYEAIYERVLPPAAKAAAHRLVVEAAMARKIAPGERLALARHAIQADAPELIGQLALDAARLALSHGAPATARELLEEGLVTLPPEHPARGRYMGLLGEIARQEGQTVEAIDLFEAARAALTAGPERQGVALALAHALADAGEDARAIPCWREAAGYAQSLDDMDGLTFALAGLAEAQMELGELDDALSSAEAALGVSADAGPLPRARAMMALGVQLANAGRERQAEGIALMQRAAALLEAEGDRPRLLAIQRRLAEAELGRGELLFARDTAARARDLAGPEEPEPYVRGMLLHATVHWALGAADVAQAEAGEARRIAEQQGYLVLAAEARGLEGLARAIIDPPTGAMLTAEAIERMPEASSSATKARLWLWHAEALLAARQFPEAANALYEAQGPVRLAGIQDLAGTRTFLLGVWAASTGDRERARQELRATLAQPNQWLVARAALLLGALAAEAGARAEAAGWLEQARRGALALGAERLAAQAERQEQDLAKADGVDDGSPAYAAQKLAALFDDARGLLPALLAPTDRLQGLHRELVAARALNALWPRLFDAMDPFEMARAVADAVFAASDARRVFLLDRDLRPWAARARTGDLPYQPGMVRAALCARAIETLHWQHEPEEAVLVIPLMTSRRAIGTLYVLGWAADEPSEGLAGLEGIAAAGALAIERMVLPAPGD